MAAKSVQALLGQNFLFVCTPTRSYEFFQFYLRRFILFCCTDNTVTLQVRRFR